MEPTLGQTEIIQGGMDSGLKEIRKTFTEMVVIPDKKKFKKIYKDFYPNELLPFGKKFAFALEQ